ncbi:MAG: ADP-ribosylglycohydrolase family protein [Clostridia bacterium]|nr:ADP-ribosylglycohydrolase family protein [Clostridia bacterium]
MIGAIIGDYVGSIYEMDNIKTTDFPFFSPFCRFTDDTVMSIAVADALMNSLDMAASLSKYGRMYPAAGYGGSFRRWLASDDAPSYGSYGNGSAMRASAAGWVAASLEEALQLAEQSALPTHSHPEGIRGAQVVAGCIWLLRQGKTKAEIRQWVTDQDYSLDFTIDQIRPVYQFDVSCQGSVPHAIAAFLEAEDFESAIRLGISIGGDSDTIACIAGALAEVYWGAPDWMVAHVVARLPEPLYTPLADFEARYARPLPEVKRFNM